MASFFAAVLQIVRICIHHEGHEGLENETLHILHALPGVFRTGISHAVKVTSMGADYDFHGTLNKCRMPPFQSGKTVIERKFSIFKVD
jgi:hypothetical protein